MAVLERKALTPTAVEDLLRVYPVVGSPRRALACTTASARHSPASRCVSWTAGSTGCRPSASPAIPTTACRPGWATFSRWNGFTSPG